MLLCNPCPCCHLLMSLLLFLSENLWTYQRLAKLVTTKCNDKDLANETLAFFMSIV